MSYTLANSNHPFFALNKHQKLLPRQFSTLAGAIEQADYEYATRPYYLIFGPDSTLSVFACNMLHTVQSVGSSLSDY